MRRERKKLSVTDSCRDPGDDMQYYSSRNKAVCPMADTGQDIPLGRPPCAQSKPSVRLKWHSAQLTFPIRRMSPSGSKTEVAPLEPDVRSTLDFVAKVENRAVVKISRKLIFSRLHTATLSGIDTTVCGRFCEKRCGPSHRRMKDAPAVLKIFVRQSKRLFQHYPLKSRHRQAMSVSCPTTEVAAPTLSNLGRK
jgi:hypothetical protein